MFELIESIKDYNVLFVGDSIVDEYVYVQPLGKSPKEYLIPVREEERESFDGGTVAAAQHLKTFCKRVESWTGKRTTIKTRYVDRTYLKKLFEVQSSKDNPLHNYGYPQIKYEVVVITDFGHSIAMPTMPGFSFVAVNAQTNAANVGYNLITKYPRADYVCIDEPEARLAAGDRHSSIEDVIYKLAHGHFKRMVITLGKGGAIGWDDDTGFHRCDAYTDKIVDTMGAGDAFFAVTAPMARNGDMDSLLRIGNAAGALKCGIVGHRQSVTKDALVKFLRERQ